MDSYVDRKTVVTCGKEIKGELGRAANIDRIVWRANPRRGRYRAKELFVSSLHKKCA
jgi:hypothetical protein